MNIHDIIVRNSSKAKLNRLLCSLALIWSALLPDGAKAGTLVYGGTEYGVYDISGWHPENYKTQDWFLPAHAIEPVVGLYHLHRDVVTQQIRAMRASGQNSIALVIWNLNMADEKHCCNDGQMDGVWGHVIDSSSGDLRPQQADNLNDILKLIAQLGFKLVFIRFGPQGQNSPESWHEWQEERFQENANFVANIRRRVETALAGTGTSAMFDLSIECGGIVQGQTENYFVRLWKNYTQKFGASDSIGCSIAYAPNRTRRLISWIKEANLPMPKSLGVDIYGPVSAPLVTTAAEMAPDVQSLFLMETQFDDPTTAQEIREAIAHMGPVQLGGIFQWPIIRERRSIEKHFSNAAVSGLSSPTQFEHYKTLLQSAH